MAKKKEDYAGFKYIKERQKYLLSINDFRCFNVENYKPKCEKPCDKCLEYYNLKL